MIGEPAVRITDPAWFAIALDVWDADSDGYITEEEAAVEHQVDFQDYSIRSQVEILDTRNLLVSRLYHSEALINLREVYLGQLTTDNANVAFGGLTQLETIDIGNLKYLNNSFANGCTSLKKVILNDVLTEIGTLTFQDCPCITEMTLPDSLVTMSGYGNFVRCTSMKKITIGKGIKTMGSNVFRSCTALEGIYIKATTPPIIGTDFLYDCPSKIYVPTGCGAAYKAATNWSVWASRIQEYDF